MAIEDRESVYRQFDRFKYKAYKGSNRISRKGIIGSTPFLQGWQEMLRRIGAAVGRDKIFLPMSLMKAAVFLIDWLPFFRVTRDQLMMLAEGNTADDEPLVLLAGTPPRKSDAEMLSYLADCR